MTNNTEQRKDFEAVEFLDELMELYDFTLPARAYCELRAALAQREQEAPSLCTAEEAAEDDIKRQIADQMACAIGDLLDTKKLTPQMVDRLRGLFHSYTY
jgi:hypothetical protein